MILKRCPRCRQEFELNSENFGANRTTASGFATYCRPCSRVIQREFLVSKGGVRDYKLRERYGVTAADVAEMAEKQNGLCAICSTPLNFENRTAHVDHGHIDGKIRGVLCSSCNQGLGNFKDDVDRLMSAAVYLLAQENVLGEIVKGGQ